MGSIAGADRPRRYVSELGRKYPKLWKLIDEFRAQRGRNGIPQWPFWCFAPMDYTLSLCGQHAVTYDLDTMGDARTASSLAAWRATQGIYRFHSALYVGLKTTDFDGDLPAQVLKHLPEWCVYILTPNATYEHQEMFGFFAHLDSESNSGEAVLHLLIDRDDGLILTMPIYLGKGSLIDGLLGGITAQAEHA